MPFNSSWREATLGITFKVGCCPAGSAQLQQRRFIAAVSLRCFEHLDIFMGEACLRVTNKQCAIHPAIKSRLPPAFTPGHQHTEYTEE